MTWTEFRKAVAMHLAGVAFEQMNLIAFIEANHGPIDDMPDPVVWSERFCELLGEKQEAPC